MCNSPVFNVGFAALLIALAAMLPACEAPQSARGGEEPFTQAPDLPPSPQTLYAMSRILNAQGKIAQARFVLDRLLRQHPDFRPAYSDMADLLMREGKTDEAVEMLKKACEKWPDDAVLANNMGMCWMGKNDPARALDYFSLAVSLDPQSPGHRANQAAAMGLTGRYDESLEAYKKILPEPEAHYNIALLAEARGDKPRAQQEYDQARALGFEAK